MRFEKLLNGRNQNKYNWEGGSRTERWGGGGGVSSRIINNVSKRFPKLNCDGN